MPPVSILHDIKSSLKKMVDNVSSSKIVNRIRQYTDGKYKEETAASTPVSSSVPEKKKELSDQEEQTSQTVAEAAKDEGTGESVPDVLLDVPTLKINELKLNLDDLDAHVALQSDLGNLIRINIGAHVSIKKLDLDLKGVDAKAVLKVRLKDVYKIFSRAFESLDNNPDLTNLTGSIEDARKKAVNEDGKISGEKPLDSVGTETKESIEGKSSVIPEETRHRLRIDE